METTIKALVQYGTRPIYRLVFKCPKCDKWFNYSDVTDVDISYESELSDYVQEIVRKVDYDNFSIA